MALVSCSECGGKLSDKAATCPHCGAPLTSTAPPLAAESVAPEVSAEKKPLGQNPVAIGLTLLVVILLAAKCAGGGGAEKAAEFGWNEALTMCQGALKRSARDPEKADIPYVPNSGAGDEFYYAWGPSTKMARMRNGFGIEVAASAACTVSKSQKRITSLSLNGQSIL